MAKRIVLAYSGGLDTSVAVKWLQLELGAEVTAVEPGAAKAAALTSILMLYLSRC